PFAQWHYPFENKEIFEQNWPADFISEAIDQTRGWFYSLMAISTLLFGKAPYENVLVLGHVQDEQGRKMSKHIGNVVDPWSVLDKQGADAVRWYFYANGAPWLPTRFSGSLVSEMQGKFIGTLWNTYAFFCLYASIDNYDPCKDRADEKDFTMMDRWVISRLNTLVDYVDKGLNEYKVTETSRAISAFVDELSNWYVRLSRERFWGKGMEGTKKAAFETLYTVLVTLTKLLAPYIPFITENMYQNLVVGTVANAPESVHLCDFPAADLTKVDKPLEQDMSKVEDIVQLGRACRNLSSLKVRQPLSRVLVKGESVTGEPEELIKSELNVKDVEFVSDATAFTTYQLKPQLRTLGKKYGKLLGKISEALKQMDGNQVVAGFEKGEDLVFEVDGQQVELEKDDVLTNLTQKEGFVAQSDAAYTVVLDTNLTEELINEGYIRELISKAQQLRKDAGFEVTDRICLSIQTTDALQKVFDNGRDVIMKAVLATSLTLGEAADGAYVKEVNLNGVNAAVGVKVV
ncbi:MAG: class I tRNA ligase family protein, partial [Clostridia bacterium]|nr:class I tRNA ligase family protein [Clostridia bacterium]